MMDTTTKQTYEVGDILHGSWGYDQTNCEYYEIVGLTPKGYVLREIAQESVPGTEGFMSDARLPVKGKYVGTRIVKTRLNKWGSIAIPVHEKAKTKVYLSKWTGGHNYCSWYA